jgi:hypothetical protein
MSRQLPSDVQVTTGQLPLAGPNGLLLHDNGERASLVHLGIVG